MEEQVIKRARLCQKIVEAAASTVGGQAEDFATTAFVDLIAGVGDHFALRTVVLLDSSGNTITSTTGETIIGARDGVSYSLRIILKGRLLCEKFAAMKINAYTDLSCALKLHYHNVIYSTPSDGYSLFTDGRVQSLGHFDAQATSKLIDITFFLKEAYQNYCEGRTVSDIILSLRHSGSLTYLQSAGNVRVVNEYASFYLENSTIVTNRPSLIVTDRSSPLPEESPKEKINVGETARASFTLPTKAYRTSCPSAAFGLRNVRCLFLSGLTPAFWRGRRMPMVLGMAGRAIFVKDSFAANFIIRSKMATFLTYSMEKENGMPSSNAGTISMASRKFICEKKKSIKRLKANSFTPTHLEQNTKSKLSARARMD